MSSRIGTNSIRRALLGAAVAVIALTAPLAAFSQSGHEYTVTMGNMDYGKLPGGLKAGDTVVWVNHDTVLHSVTARDHSFDIRLNPGQSARMTLQKAGRMPFYCLFHPTMSGTLVVEAK